MGKTNDTGIRFEIDGQRFTLAEMLGVNASVGDEELGDEELCAWLKSAKPGDVWDEMHSERVECVRIELPKKRVSLASKRARAARAISRGADDVIGSWADRVRGL